MIVYRLQFWSKLQAIGNCRRINPLFSASGCEKCGIRAPGNRALARLNPLQRLGGQRVRGAFGNNQK